jgi:hypothetical protein
VLKLQSQISASSMKTHQGSQVVGRNCRQTVAWMLEDDDVAFVRGWILAKGNHRAVMQKKIEKTALKIVPEVGFGLLDGRPV